jgi:hypothetical protein
MKRAIFVFFLFILASSASATVYKWVDERGVVNYTDDFDNVPPAYRNDVDEINSPKRLIQIPSQNMVVSTLSGRARTPAPPPIAQALIREGDFAIQLAKALKAGMTQNETEAENLLASAGIAPRNGWIADYPMTPDIIVELQDSIGAAVDSDSLAMNKDEAMKVFRDLIGQQGLSVGPDNQGLDTEGEAPQNDDEYSNPEVVNNYYDDQGPPVVTYYAPPPNYVYLYSWVPYPFRCLGSRFRGFFVLNDFHRFVFVNGKKTRITNHIVDPKTRRGFSIDARTRGIGNPSRPETGVPHAKRETSPLAQRSASSILERSQNQARLRGSVPPGTGSEPARRTPSGRNSNSPIDAGHVAAVRPPTTPQRMDTVQRRTSPGGSGNPPSVATVPRSQVSPGGSPFAGSHGGDGFGGGGFWRGGSGNHR